MKFILSFHVFLLYSLLSIAQQQFVIQSEHLNAPDTIWAFIPDNKSQNQTYPLVYLLHGWSGTYRQWDKIIDCQSYSNEYNTIVVCPDGLYDSWYIDSPKEGENDFVSFFNSDLIPYMSQNYKINHDSIFITGFSMGGHGALYLSQNNPDYFLGSGSLSGLLDLTNWQNHYGISRVLGIEKSENNDKILWDYSVIGNANKLKPIDKIIISCGSEDAFLTNNNSFVNYGKEVGIDIVFIKNKGSHNAKYWKSAVREHFEFFYR